MTRVFFWKILLFILIFSSDQIVCQSYSDFLSLVSTLESKYQVSISYDADLIRNDQSFKDFEGIEHKNLQDALFNIFKNSTISYKIIDGNKLLLRREEKTPGPSVLKGRIWDGSSGNPLAFASVFVPGTTHGTISDENGNFSLSIDGTDTLMVQYLGYESKIIYCQHFTGEISLKPKAYTIDEVTIYIHPKIMNDPGKEYFSVNSEAWISKTAAQVFGSDIIRSLQLLPGIMADSDDGGKLRIRGSESDEVLIMMDGIPLYKVDHYYGIFGAVNPFSVHNLTLYKNNQPLQYETRTGGLLILNSNDRINHLKGKIEGDFLKLNGFLEVPIGDSGGIVLGGRWNHTDPFQTLLSTSADNVDLENALIDRNAFRRKQIEAAIPEFNFHDLNAKIYYDFSPGTSLKLSGIAIRDEYRRNYMNEYRLIINRRLAQNNEGFGEYERWQNDGFSIELNHQVAESTKLIAHYYNAYYENNNRVEARIFLRNTQETIIDGGYLGINNNILHTSGIDLYLENENDFTLGIKYIDRVNRLGFKENQKVILRRNQNLEEYSVFGKKVFDIHEKFKVDFGGKFNYVDTYSIATFSPYINLSFQAHPEVTMKASYSRLYQNMRELQMETRLGLNQQYFVLADNEIYPQGLAHKYMVGMGWTNQKWGMDLELYYKDQQGAIGYLPVQPGITSTGILPNISSLFRVYSGTMKSRGLDALLYYDNNRFYSQLAYTWSKSENIFREIYRGNAFPSQYDRRHQLKWFNSYKIISGFTLGNTLVYTSGRPYLSFEKIADSPDRNEITIDDVVLNLPAYFRLDLSASFHFNVNNANAYLTASAYNITNRQNIKYIQQTFRLRTDAVNSNVILGFESPLLERLYNISLGVAF